MFIFHLYSFWIGMITDNLQYCGQNKTMCTSFHLPEILLWKVQPAITANLRLRWQLDGDGVKSDNYGDLFSVGTWYKVGGRSWFFIVGRLVILVMQELSTYRSNCYSPIFIQLTAEKIDNWFITNINWIVAPLILLIHNSLIQPSQFTI